MKESTALRASIAVLLVAGALAYANSFSAPFQLDDFGSITDNPTIQHLSRLGDVLSPPRESGVTVNGRPLLNLTFALNYAISGLNVWSYHLANLAIHLAAALALFGLVRRTLDLKAASCPPPAAFGLPPSVAIALGAALLWMLHPLQTEAVTYVVQRAESLVSLFYLLTLYCFVRWSDASRGAGSEERGRDQPSPSLRLAGATLHLWSALSIVCCVLGMATKEVMVSAPLIVLLFDRTFVARSFKAALQLRWRYYAALCSTWILLAWLVFHASGRGGTAGAGGQALWWHYALTQFRAVAMYLKLVVWPSPLVFDYGIGLEQNFGAVAFQATIIVALVVATMIALKRWPVAGFFGAVFFALLAPSSSVVPVVTQTMAEHRIYLALAVIAVSVALLGYKKFGAASTWGIAVVALALGIATLIRNQDYRSGLALWGDTVAKYPSSTRGQNNYGASLVAAGRVDEGIVHYREAIRLRPEYLRAHSNLAQALMQKGDGPGALDQYAEIIRLHPDYEGHVAFARMLEQAGRRDDAIGHLREAIRLKPDASEPHILLGNIFLRGNNVDPAIAEYRLAIAANPNDAAAYSNLGNALASTGKLDDGAAAHERALQLNPASTGSRIGLALIRINQNRKTEAIDLLNRALADDPGNAVARTALSSITGKAQ